MKLQVSLDDQWVNEYQDTIAAVITAEIHSAVRAEVKKVISVMVKSQLDHVRKQLEAEIKKIAPVRFGKLLAEFNERLDNNASKA